MLGMAYNGLLLPYMPLGPVLTAWPGPAYDQLEIWQLTTAMGCTSHRHELRQELSPSTS